jgi:hypothetical protein
MKIGAFAALAFAIGISASQADQRTASSQAEGPLFAAMSLTKDQGMRAIISNVLGPGNDSHQAPCLVQVSFVAGDGSQIGNVTTVQLKAGESASVVALKPSKLVRASVSIGNVVDRAKVCALRTSVEIFDVQTDTTFVSIPGESFGTNGECSAPAAHFVAPKNLSSGKNLAPIATSSSLSVGTTSPNNRSPILAATPPTNPR